MFKEEVIEEVEDSMIMIEMVDFVEGVDNFVKILIIINLH